jgi:hypothetical protein
VARTAHSPSSSGGTSHSSRPCAPGLTFDRGVSGQVRVDQQPRLGGAPGTFTPRVSSGPNTALAANAWHQALLRSWRF